jgi:two-component system response regulator CpxR
MAQTFGSPQRFDQQLPSTCAESGPRMKAPPALSSLSVLLVDDDTELCLLLTQYLEQEGYKVESAHRGATALERVFAGAYSIVILDVMLPDIYGFDVLRDIRASSPMPVMMLTARGEERDRIVGLEMGADDYLAKPFNPRELSARIAAILRRSGRESSARRPGLPGYVAVEDVALDEGMRTAWRDGEKMDLTSVEFNLLEKFLKAAGQVVSREDLVREILGREFSPFDRSIDTHVSNLRKKLGPAANGLERIKGIRGIGYLYSLCHGAGGMK